MSVADLKLYRKTPYEAISPKRPELSQTRRTILITGGSSGIGYAIARSFIEASAKRVIIIGSSPHKLDVAVDSLKAETAKKGDVAEILGYVCDVSSLTATDKLWQTLTDQDIVVDVLVLNAAATGQAKAVLDIGLADIWKDYEMNLRHLIDFCERFYKQTGQGGSDRKHVVNVSTSMTYQWSSFSADRPTYGLTKNAGTTFLQLVARDIAPEVMQVVSFHPGGVRTPGALSVVGDLPIQWDHENLPGNFAVWAASQEAEFLHGRFVWANWDVDELKSGPIRESIDASANYLKTAYEGLCEKDFAMQF